jgi:fused signal recognition particle receptor
MLLRFFRKLFCMSKKKMGFALGAQIKKLLGKGISQETLEHLERIFFEADLGTETSMQLIKKLKEFNNVSTKSLLQEIHKHLVNKLQQYPQEIHTSQTDDPTVILVIGVNGNGKTTSVAKIANMYKKEKKKVLVAAADTFRAAASEQLAKWAGIADADIVKGAPKSAPSAIVYDAISAGKARKASVVIIDTAGRLQTKTNLMQELEKIQRTSTKLIPEAPHETLLVIDATTGQNAIDQAKTFNQFAPISGIILTKLDGTAKGGIVISIQEQLKVPVKFIGVGEGINDFKAFDAEKFVTDLLS